MEQLTDFILGGPKITEDNDFSHLLGPRKEIYDKYRQHIKRQIHHFVYKILYSQNHDFPVVMYRCESGNIKKAKCQRIDALNCGVGEDSWGSLEMQVYQTSQF